MSNENAVAERMQREVIDQAMTDPDYREGLKSDPRAALAEKGLNLPQNISIEVIEDTADTVHLVLPAVPTEGSLSDEDLEQIAGGGHSCSLHPCPWV